MTLVCIGKETCLSTGGQMSYLGSFLFPPNFLINLPVLNKTQCGRQTTKTKSFTRCWSLPEKSHQSMIQRWPLLVSVPEIHKVSRRIKMPPDDSAYQELHLSTATSNLISYQTLGIAKNPNRNEHQSFMYNSVSSNSSPSPFCPSQETRETLHLPQKY